MKSKFFFFTLCFLLLNCNASKSLENQSLTSIIYENDNYSFQYPGNWYSFDWHGHMNFTSKELKRKDYNIYNNHFHITRSDLKLVNSKNNLKIKDLEGFVIWQDLMTNQHFTDVKTIHKIEEDSNGKLYTVINERKWKGKSSRKFTRHYLKNNIVYSLHFKTNSNIHEKYLAEAMIIFDSFKLK